MDQQGRKKLDRKSNRARQKNKRGDSKVESNDSPEIPDRTETSDIPGLSSGVFSLSPKLGHNATGTKWDLDTTEMGHNGTGTQYDWH